MKVLARIEEALARARNRSKSDEVTATPKRIDGSADRRVKLAEARQRLLDRNKGVAPSIHDVWREL